MDNKELAFLILHYRGPGLLDIVHKAIQLPSTLTTTTTYRLLISSRPIKSSTDVTSNVVVDYEF